MPYFLAFFALFAASTWLVRSHSSLLELGYDPTRLLRGFIIIICALWLLPLFKKPDVNYVWFGLYFAAAAISVFAYAFGTRFRFRISMQVLTPEKTYVIMFLLSAPFAIYYMASGSLVRDLTSILTLTVYERRSAHWESFGASEEGLLFLLAAFAFPAAHIWARVGWGSSRYWSLLLWLFFFVYASASGSRALIVFSAVVCVLIWIRKTRFNFRRMIAQRPWRVFGIAIVGAVAINYFFIAFLAEKAPNTDFARLAVLVTGAEPTPFLTTLSDNTNGTLGFFAISLGYFSSTLTFFARFMSDSAMCHCTETGPVYNFPFLDSFFKVDWFTIRLNLAYFWEIRGTGANPWATGYRDFFIDFGIVGSLIFNAAFCFVLGSITRSAAMRRDTVSWLASAFATAMLLITPLLSPLLLLEMSLPFYLLVAMFSVTIPARRTGRSAQRDRPAPNRPAPSFAREG